MRTPTWVKRTHPITHAATCPQCRANLKIETYLYGRILDLFYRLDKAQKGAAGKALYPRVEKSRREGAKILHDYVHNALSTTPARERNPRARKQRAKRRSA